jgi:hypothetical protein
VLYIDIIIQTGLIAAFIVNLFVAVQTKLFEKKIELYLNCIIIMLVLITGRL